MEASVDKSQSPSKTEEPVKRKRGRPPKEKPKVEEPVEPKRRGRPPKAKVDEVIVEEPVIEESKVEEKKDEPDSGEKIGLDEKIRIEAIEPLPSASFVPDPMSGLMNNLRRSASSPNKGKEKEPAEKPKNKTREKLNEFAENANAVANATKAAALLRRAQVEAKRQQQEAANATLDNLEKAHRIQQHVEDRKKKPAASPKASASAVADDAMTDRIRKYRAYCRYRNDLHCPGSSEREIPFASASADKLDIELKIQGQQMAERRGEKMIPVIIDSAVSHMEAISFKFKHKIMNLNGLSDRWQKRKEENPQLAEAVLELEIKYSYLLTPSPEYLLAYGIYELCRDCHVDNGSGNGARARAPAVADEEKLEQAIAQPVGSSSSSSKASALREKYKNV